MKQKERHEMMRAALPAWAGMMWAHVPADVREIGWLPFRNQVFSDAVLTAARINGPFSGDTPELYITTIEGDSEDTDKAAVTVATEEGLAYRIECTIRPCPHGPVVDTRWVIEL